MILEGIITTMSVAGKVNIAPMGPKVDSDFRKFLLRPFSTSQTYRNLQELPEGVFHITDDVWLLAQAAVSTLDPLPPMVAATRVNGFVLADCCRYFEFRMVSVDDSQERVSMEVEVVHQGCLRDFFGLNRAKHAVVEAAILATRIHLIPKEEILLEIDRLQSLVEKTGGEEEKKAFKFLQEYLGGV